MHTEPPADARRLLLDGLIDYAGLFPPASLDMKEAVAGYRAARAAPHAWIVHRFIVPASRLGELGDVLDPAADEEAWPIALLLDAGDWPDFAASMEAAGEFAERLVPAARLESAEAKLPAERLRVPTLADEVSRAATAIGAGGLVPFFEVPLVADWDEAVWSAVEDLAAARAATGVEVGAKLRCGGPTAELFPTPRQAAQFIIACHDADLPFKCTAGLHHPIRHDDPATGFTHHGFLNLLGAALLARAEAAEHELVEIISERDPASFTLETVGFGWGHFWAGVGEIEGIRRVLFVGYGSCDAVEPIDELAALGALPGRA